MNWRFSPDVQVPFSVILDKGRREFFGISRVATTNNNIIQAIVTADEGDNGLDDFASSEAMTVKFFATEGAHIGRPQARPSSCRPDARSLTCIN